MADIAIFRINYKSDFILTLQSDAGWLTPFCIKFWTGAPSQAYFVGYDGTTYTHCAPVVGDPTKLAVQFDDHNLPIGNLKFQVGYHFTVADFPTTVEDEVINQAAVIIDQDGTPMQVMLDFTGETAPDIQFALPAYANEAQRIANELEREQEFAQMETEFETMQHESETATAGAENVNAELEGNILTVTDRNGVSKSVNTKGEKGDPGEKVQSDWDATDTSSPTYIKNKPSIYTKTEVNTLLNGKQDALVSGTNIKTVNNTSVLGGGNISVEPPVDRAADAQTGKLGYKVLKGDASFASQVTAANTIYEIRDVFDLNDGSVTIPAGCTLKFDGGMIKNGTITGADTVIQGEPIKLFEQINFSGTYICSSYAEWFDGDLKKAIETFGAVSLLDNKNYYVSETINFPFGASITGAANSVVKSASDVSIMFNLGYHSTLKGFTVIVDSDTTVVNIQTENISKTYSERNYRGNAYPGNVNILISGVRFRSSSTSLTKNCITIKSDGYYSNGRADAGFWGILITDCLIAGTWKNGILIDNGSNVNNNDINCWLTGCTFRNITASNLSDGFVLCQKINNGYNSTGKISKILFDRCQYQYFNNNTYCFKIDSGDITIDECIAWDFSSIKPYQINKDDAYVEFRNIALDTRDYNTFIILSGTSDNVGFRWFENDVISGAMSEYFLNGLGNNDTVKVGNFRRLPYGTITFKAGAINMRQLKLEDWITRGVSGDEAKIIITKSHNYDSTLITLKVVWKNVACLSAFLVIPNNAISTDDPGNWIVMPGIFYLSNKTALDNYNGYGYGLLLKFGIQNKLVNKGNSSVVTDALGHEFTSNQSVNSASNLPVLPHPTASYNSGKMMLDKTTNRVAVYNETKQKWYEDGAEAGTATSGTTSNRPSGDKIYIGYMYFDTSLSPARPIFASAIASTAPYTVTWVDATGAIV